MRTVVFRTIGFVATMVMAGDFAWSQARSSEQRANSALVYHGKLVLPTGKVVEREVTATIKIYSPEPSKCLLWSETQTFTPVKGAFAIELGYDSNRLASGSGSASAGAGSFREVFLNNPGLTISGLSCDSGTSYTPTASDDRLMSVVLWMEPLP